MFQIVWANIFKKPFIAPPPALPAPEVFRADIEEMNRRIDAVNQRANGNFIHLDGQIGELKKEIAELNRRLFEFNRHNGHKI